MSGSGDLWIELVTWLLVLLGLVGTVIPVIPGQMLIFGAAGFCWWFLGEDSSLRWWSFLILAVIYALGQCAEVVSGAVGSRWLGGGKWGMLGAGLGAFVGVFFFPWGLLLGPVVGAFLGERLIAKKEWEEAAKAGLGSALGAVAGLGFGFVAGVIMVSYLLADRFWF